MAKTIIDHLNAIYTNQREDYFDTLDDVDKKSYNVYMLNRFISMNVDYIHIVGEAQLYGSMKPREHYLFFSQILPKRKQFNKYIKATAEDKYEKWLVETVANHFTVSRYEAVDYLNLFYRTEAGKADLLTILQTWAIDPKLIKKAKL